MKSYEVIREIYNNCGKFWRVDASFPDEVECENPEQAIAGWFGGNLPKMQKEELSDGGVVYTTLDDMPQRYTFTEF